MKQHSSLPSLCINKEGVSKKSPSAPVSFHGAFHSSAELLMCQIPLQQRNMWVLTEVKENVKKGKRKTGEGGTVRQLPSPAAGWEGSVLSVDTTQTKWGENPGFKHKGLEMNSSFSLVQLCRFSLWYYYLPNLAAAAHCGYKWPFTSCQKAQSRQGKGCSRWMFVH